MGGLILVASIIIWALSYFPQRTPEDVPAEYLTEALTEMQAVDSIKTDSNDAIALATKEYQQEKSILGEIGHLCEPVVRPLGFDWKISVSLLAGAAAKEVVVSTLGVLYVGDDDADALAKRLKSPSPVSGQPPFTPPQSHGVHGVRSYLFPMHRFYCGYSKGDGLMEIRSVFHHLQYSFGLASVIHSLQNRPSVLNQRVYESGASNLMIGAPDVFV